MTDVLRETAHAAPRRIRPEDTWDLAREQYLAGATAEEVCRRHDLGLSAFWARARRGGWRRADQPAPEPLDDALDLDAPRESLDRLLAADRAEQRHRDRNTAEEMRAVTRTARGIEAQTISMLRQIQAENLALKREPNTVQSKNSTAVPPTLPDPDEPGLSRAERRRRLKYREKSR